jgi:hypothetical protein
VTRADLPPAVQAVQAVHAALEFAAAHRDLRPWAYPLALLAVPDEAGLFAVLDRGRAAGVACEPFCEPDLAYALTAVALEPRAARLARHCPLALRGGDEQ